MPDTKSSTEPVKDPDSPIKFNKMRRVLAGTIGFFGLASFVLLTAMFTSINLILNGQVHGLATLFVGTGVLILAVAGRVTLSLLSRVWKLHFMLTPQTTRQEAATLIDTVLRGKKTS